MLIFDLKVSRLIAQIDLSLIAGQLPIFPCFEKTLQYYYQQNQILHDFSLVFGPLSFGLFRDLTAAHFCLTNNSTAFLTTVFFYSRHI